ncbi:MAG TPA: CPBP family intramembrane metalloprotease, partial [Deltaproteobacteria bacterium]|nr:CPBP family intramembrane metalloprotease [Deltaproteobacteria bacterium]
MSAPPTGWLSWPRALAAGAFLGWLWVGESLGGRRRQGVLEAWLTTRIQALDVVIAVWALGMVAGLVGFGLTALIGGRWGAWIHAPAGLAVHVALSVRVFATLPASASTLRPLLGIAPLELVGVWLAGVLAPTHPWLAASIPLGGSIAAVGGGLVGGAAWLADAAAIGWSLLGLERASRSLRGSELVPSSLGATSARRSRGRWWPELAAGVLLALSGTPLPWLEVRHPVGWWIPMLLLPLLLWALPVSLAPRIVGLPRAMILPLEAPPPPRLLAAGLVGLGVGGAWLLAPWVGLRWSGAGLSGELLGPQLAALPWGSVIVGLAVTALCEELLFRGAIQWVLSRGAWRACVGQALLYGLAIFSPLLGPSGLVAGLLLGALRVVGGSLL